MDSMGGVGWFSGGCGVAVCVVWGGWLGGVGTNITIWPSNT